MINKSNRRFLKSSFNRYNKSIVWFPVKELMAVGNELMTGRFKRNIKSNSYLVHYRPYQGTKKGKQVASSTKWGLGDNVVLRGSTAHVKQKRCVYLCGWLERQQHLSSFTSCQPNRNLFGVVRKLKESIFKSNNQINSTVRCRTFKRIDQNLAKHSIGISVKK